MWSRSNLDIAGIATSCVDMIMAIWWVRSNLYDVTVTLEGGCWWTVQGMA
jgi:hypothetical protein